jgi:hypothetical protein
VRKEPLTTAQNATGTTAAGKAKEEQAQLADTASSELREQQDKRESSSNIGLDRNEEAKIGTWSARSEPAAPPPPAAAAPMAKAAPENRPSDSDDVLATRDASRGALQSPRKNADQPLIAQSRERAPSTSAGASVAREAEEKSVDKLSAGTERAKKSESRAVGGKQFRRVNGEWVDSAFKGSSTVNVKRGSEQYRALLADEPGLRQYAEQLSGTVTVVWNGRAYRFH